MPFTNGPIRAALLAIIMLPRFAHELSVDRTNSSIGFLRELLHAPSLLHRHRPLQRISRREDHGWAVAINRGDVLKTKMFQNAEDENIGRVPVSARLRQAFHRLHAVFCLPAGVAETTGVF